MGWSRPVRYIVVLFVCFYLAFFEQEASDAIQTLRNSNARATPRRLLFSRRIRRLSLAPGGLCGTCEQGELRICWVVYMSPPFRVVLESLGLDFVRSFSAFISLHGERVSVVLVGAWCSVTASSGGFDSDGAGLASHRMAADVEEFWLMYRWRWGVIQRSFVPPRQFWWTRQKFPCEVSCSPSRVFGLVYSDPPRGFAIRRLGLDGEATDVRSWQR
jgi:hypothetical protein